MALEPIGIEVDLDTSGRLRQRDMRLETPQSHARVRGVPGWCRELWSPTRDAVVMRDGENLLTQTSASLRTVPVEELGTLGR